MDGTIESVEESKTALDGELMASFMEFKSICQTLTEQLNQKSAAPMYLMENDSNKNLDFSVEKLFGTQRAQEGGPRLESLEDSQRSEQKPASPSSSFLQGVQLSPAVALFREQYERRKASTASLLSVKPLKSQMKAVAPKQELVAKKYQDILLHSKLPASTKRMFQATQQVGKRPASKSRKTSISSKSETSPEKAEPLLLRTTQKPSKKGEAEAQQVEFLGKVRQQLLTILESAEQMTSNEMDSLAKSITQLLAQNR